MWEVYDALVPSGSRLKYIAMGRGEEDFSGEEIENCPIEPEPLADIKTEEAKNHYPLAVLASDSVCVRELFG